jgi:hypothetical protein
MEHRLKMVHRRGISTHGLDQTAALAITRGIEPPENAVREHLALRVGQETVELLYPGPGYQTVIPGHGAPGDNRLLERTRHLLERTRLVTPQ